MRMMVLDLETQKSFDEVGKDKFADLKVSVAGLYDSGTDSYSSFEEKELGKLEELLKKADLIIGFNVKRFDYAVLQPYLYTLLSGLPTLDLLEEINTVMGHRVSLQSLAIGTLNDKKSGKGLEAVRLFREGKMDELKSYCLDDVRLTKEIYEYGQKHGKVFFKSSYDFQIHEIPATWKDVTPFLKKASPAPIQPTLF